jgi:hypothetical protein
MREGTFYITPELLFDRMPLPRDTELLDASYDIVRRCLIVKVRSNSIHADLNGKQLMPVFDTDADGHPYFMRWEVL